MPTMATSSIMPSLACIGREGERDDLPAVVVVVNGTTTSSISMPILSSAGSFSVSRVSTLTSPGSST